MPYDLFTIARYLRARLVTGPYAGPRGNFSNTDHPAEWVWIDRLFDHYAELRWAWTADNA